MSDKAYSAISLKSIVENVYIYARTTYRLRTTKYEFWYQ